MSILRKKTRADLSVALYFYTPCLTFTDITWTLHLYDQWGHTSRFLDVLDFSKREFDNYNEVLAIVREFLNDKSRIAARESEKTPAQKVKAYIETEKAFDRIEAQGESEENIKKIRHVQKVFQGRFLS